MGVFGVRGELRIHLHNRGSTLLHGGGEVTLVSPKGERRPVRMKTRSGSGGRVIARVEGLTDRDEAESLNGWLIEGDPGLLPELREGEYYHRDLLGLEVRRGERVLGTLSEIHDHGPVDVWTVRDGEDESYVPATRQHVLEVNLEAGYVRVAE